MPKVSRGVRGCKILTFSIYEGVFGKSMNRLCMIYKVHQIQVVFSTQRWVFDTETVIIPEKINIISFQVL
ncbi:hypothetical protein E2C01_091506 [Portunus trituberculatus]|uniref:Uncharacterized protein n=1 Tax=Portunus trituberculatus TaxID=210409 RepID=A0A5B7JT43_PORTR|nr:hypothetical protein [Portunus trituberculatus]